METMNLKKLVARWLVFLRGRDSDNIFLLFIVTPFLTPLSGTVTRYSSLLLL